MKKLLSLILSLILILGLCGCTLDEYFRFSPENNDSDDEEKITEQPDSNANKVFPIYKLKEIESIVFDTKGRPVAEALEAFYRDVNYVYYFPNIISQYVIVTYTDKTTENVKEALENLHIKISDLDRFGIKYEKWEDGSVEKVFDRNLTSGSEGEGMTFIEKDGKTILVAMDMGPIFVNAFVREYDFMGDEK